MISVVIPHLNQPDALEACLRSLDAQTLARDAFEIIVVDKRLGNAPNGCRCRSSRCTAGA
ncbi:GT2 family glycosyltransferase [Bradyrhizobium yuanmingense]|uniref:glycosyltransferase n=1 Tax=Bradyrhizobium yuanmingense TaxID=108015 RepID=UPI00351589CF